MNIKNTLLNIFRNKTRSLLTMSGIAVGVFAVVLISTIGTVGTKQVNNQLSGMGIDTLLVQVEDNNPFVALEDEDVETIKHIKGVNDAMPLMASITQGVMLDNNISCMAWGVDKNAKKIISLNALHGRLITTGDLNKNAAVCVIDTTIAEETYGRTNVVGKKMKIYLGGSYHEFEIVGVAESGLTSVQGMLTNLVPSFVYLPYTTMQNKCGRTTFDKIAVKIQDTSGSDGVVTAVNKKMNEVKGTTDSFIVNNLLQQKSQLDGVMSIITTILSLIAGISLVVSGISVMTTMLVSVTERTHEIGIKKSIGAKSRDIILEFMAESVILTLLGSAGGIAAGITLTVLGCVVMGIPVLIDTSMIVTALSFSVLIGLIFGAYPAYKAASLKPVDALRH